MTPLERLFNLRMTASKATEKADIFLGGLHQRLGTMAVYVQPEGRIILRKHGLEMELEPDEAHWAAKRLGELFDHDRWSE